MPRTPKRERRPAAAPGHVRTLPDPLLVLPVFVLALAVRVVVAFDVGHLPISRTPHFDSLEYLQWAEALAAGQYAWPSPPPHGPGYPFFLALLLKLGGGSLMFARVGQALVGAGTCLLVGLTTQRFFGRVAGIAAGVLLALYAPLAWIDVSILGEGLLLFLSAAALYCAARRAPPLLTGALIGLAVITRPTAIILLPAAWLLQRRALPLIVATLAIIAPVTIANWRTTHAFIPVQAFGGMNFYLGNSPQRDGLASARPGADWERIEPLAARAGADDDRFFIGRTASEIRAEPLAYLKLLGQKLVWTLQDVELRDTHAFAFFQRHSLLLRVLPSFFVLFGLAVAGMVVARRSEGSVRALALYVVLAMATCVVLVVGARYRLPLVIGLAPFAGLGVVALLARQRLAAVAGIAAAAFTFAWSHPASMNVAEELALTGQSLIKERRDDEAEATLRQAIAADPGSALAHHGMAILLAARGDRDGARQALVAALRANDQYAKAYAHAGQLAVEEGNAAAAGAAYTRAAELDPRNRDTLVAAAQFAGATGDPRRGMSFAKRALALQEDGQTWALLAVLAADAQDPAASDEALRRAYALLGSVPELQFTEAVVRHKQARYAEADRILRELLARAPDMANARALQQMNAPYVGR